MSKNASAGMDKARLRHFMDVVNDDIAKGLYFGGSFVIARHGEIVLQKATGHSDDKKSRKVETDSVFSLFSTTKAMNTVLTLRAIELGELSFATKIADIIPEFAGHGREKISVYDLITHTSGLPSIYTPREGMYIDRLDEMVATICEVVRPDVEPGVRLDYSPLCSHALLGEAVRRVDAKKRRYRDIIQQEIFDPLKMKDTSMGRRRDLAPRHLVPFFLGNSPTQHLGHSDFGPNGAFEEEDAEMPWVGVVSTAADMFRFADMLRRMGELDGARILSPTMLARSRQNQTGEMPNEVYKRMAEARGWPVIPGYIGLGFSLRGEKIGENLFGSLTSPETFGNYGAGTTIFWVDPERDITFVGLCTGVMNGAENIQRWRRLSDIVISAAD